MSSVRIGDKVGVWRDRGIDGWDVLPAQVVGITGRWPRYRYEIQHRSGSIGVYKRREFIRFKQEE